MHRFGMMLKSYGADFPLAQRLVESFTTFNHDRLPMTVVVPPEDLDLFASLAHEDITVLDESLLSSHLATEPFGEMRLGYINQQIVKLAFWELDIYDDYLVVDSDLVFVRPFFRRDFMFDENTPYSFLVEDNDLQTDPRYYQEQWQSRSGHLKRIKELVDLQDARTLTCHNHQVFSSIVLRSMKQDFMAPHNYSYQDLIRLSPYEFSWYNFWLQKSLTIPIHPREPLVKVFHHEGQHFEYILRGTTPGDLARGYLAVVVNSNFSRDLGLIQVDASKPVALSPYLSYREVVQLLKAKARGSLRRLFRRT
jgi:hypothetical protein